MTLPLTDDWLPALTPFSGRGDEWPEYEELIYSFFRADFVSSRPLFRAQRLQIIERLLDGRERTFWHLITEGEIEDERTPCLRRCARIRWVRCVIERCADSVPILAWVNYRSGRKNLVLALADFSYSVVIGDRKNFHLLLTAYAASYDHERRRLERQYKEAIKAGGVLVFQGDPATPSTHGR